MTPLTNDGLNPLLSAADDSKGFPSLSTSLSAVSSNLHRSRSVQGVRTSSGQGNGLDGQHDVKPTRDPHLFVNIPRIPHATEAALSALQYLPTPIIVLSSFKTIILANEAMGRLLGLEHLDNIEDQEDGDAAREDLLRGQSLSQIGIDVIEDGQSIWVSWEAS